MLNRFLTDDFINKDPRALLNVAKMATLADMVTPTAQYLRATGADELTLEANCVFCIADTGVFKTDETKITAGNLDTGDSFAVGNDYYVYVVDAGDNDSGVIFVSLNSTFPAGATAFNSRKIGGFHYGVCRGINTKSMKPVNTDGVEFGANWQANVFNGILPLSVWTLKFRPSCSPEGMVYIGGGTWADIYLSSDDGAGGLKSTFNSVPMTGTEGMSQYTFNERSLAVGKRLMSYDEFCKTAFGSPEGLAGDNTNAWSAGSGRNPTGGVLLAVSSTGARDCVGNVWEWLAEMVIRTDQTGNGHSPSWGFDTASPFPGYGNIYEYYNASLVALLAGGHWGDGAAAGARAVSLNNFPWGVYAPVGVRLACDCL